MAAGDGLPVQLACRVLGVSESGYYAALSRPPSARAIRHAWLTDQIREIHVASHGTYGARRVHAELTLGLGWLVNRTRVARLMRQAGIQGLYRRRRRGCTVRDPADKPSEDLVNRQFQVDRPDRLWVTDIERHEALTSRVGVKDHHRRAVAAAR